jgi:hypothetical protein
MTNPSPMDSLGGFTGGDFDPEHDDTGTAESPPFPSPPLPALPVPLTDATGQLDVDTMRTLAPQVRISLIEHLRSAAAVLRAGRGAVVVPEDVHDLTRRTVAAGEVLRQWADAFTAAAEEADAIAEEEALTAVGGMPGYEEAPAGSLFVPDGAGQRIAVTPDWRPGESTWDVDTLVGWLAEDTVAETGRGEHAVIYPDPDERVFSSREAASLIRDGMDRLLDLGTYTPGIKKLDALRRKLSERGRDGDAAVLRQVRTVGPRAYRGVKISREEVK